MTFQGFVRIIFLCGLTTAFLSGLLAQSGGLSAPLVLRSQAASIAEESLAKLGSSTTGLETIGVSVSGGFARAIIENAFLDLFGRKGIRCSLQNTESMSKNLLQLTVLDQSVHYAGIANGQYRREIQTAIEARRTSNDSAAIQYLGMFKRQVVDTVAFREDSGALAADQETERTLFDRLLGPIMLISGVFLIVYLFFTVRN